MIGPSSGPSGEIADSQCHASKRKIFNDLDQGQDLDSTKRRVFDELDIDNFCEEVVRQTSCKGYFQELETPIELVASSEIVANADLLSPLAAQEAVEESPVARLEVLLVDGTNWTTVSELEQQQQQQPALDILLTSSSSSSSSSSLSSSSLSSISPSGTEPSSAETYTIEEASYQPAISANYWEPVGVPAIAPIDLHQSKETPGNNQQQQQQQSQQQFEDQENGNLSWLLNFKLDSFIGAADDKSTVASPTMRDGYCGRKPTGRLHAYASDNRRGQSNHENLSAYRQDSNQATYLANKMDNRNICSARPNGPKKPPFTYTELIEHALQEKGELTVSAIYQWISERFPYYKSNDDRWKNSVRHNLSINPHFRKGSKAPHGAGHLWAIANRSDCRPRPLVVHNPSARQAASRNIYDESQKNENIISDIMMDEVKAATASIAQPNPEEDADSILNSVTLEHSAEQILNGIKREVEVQYIIPMMVADNNEQDANRQDQQIMQTDLECSFKESDFLNPVSKEVLAEECGLISEGYLVTDLNPNALGLNMIDSEIIESENLFGEELSFQFYELTSPSQLQSA